MALKNKSRNQTKHAEEDEQGEHGKHDEHFNDYEKKIRIDSESSVTSLESITVTCERSNIQAFQQSIQASVHSGIGFPIHPNWPEVADRKPEVKRKEIL